MSTEFYCYCMLDNGDLLNNTCLFMYTQWIGERWIILIKKQNLIRSKTLKLLHWNPNSVVGKINVLFSLIDSPTKKPSTTIVLDGEEETSKKSSNIKLKK